MALTRRDLLFGLGGGAVGVALSPVPWKLLDDVSIWTQHRRALPVPAAGPVSFRAASCTLCPGGCALRVRCVGARPVSAAPAPGHPLGSGACALGLTLHHLAYHPLRLASPHRRADGRLQPVSLEAAVAEIVAAARLAARQGQAVMVLDRRPGRVASAAWRELLAALPNGVHARPADEGETLGVLGGASSDPVLLGLDLERTRTLVSFGAPVLEGWGRPGRVLACRSGMRVVQVDAWRSPSAALADEWVPVRPGGEGPLALALAHVILREQPGRGSEEARAAVAPFSPERAASRTGVAPDRVEALARELLAQGPAVAVGGGEPGAGPLGPDAERAVALVDVVLGSVGGGGIVARRPVPEAGSETGVATASLASVAAGSVGVLLLDGADDGRALPWPAVARALAPGALVVSLSPFDSGLSRRAALLVPGPAPLEGWDEVLPSPDAAVASWSVAPALLPAPEGATDSVRLARELAAALGVAVPAGSHEERLKQRAAAIRACGRGRFAARGEKGWVPADVAGADAAWETLAQGGLWIDDPAPAPRPSGRCPLPSAEALQAWAGPEAPADGLALVAFAARGTVGVTPVSPLLTKLYQETDLRTPTAVAAVSPATGRSLGIGDGRRVRIASDEGRVSALLRHDPTLPDGRIALAAGPDPSEMHENARPAAAGAMPLAVTGGDGTWRGTRVRVEEA